MGERNLTEEMISSARLFRVSPSTVLLRATVPSTSIERPARSKVIKSQDLTRELFPLITAASKIREIQARKHRDWGRSHGITEQTYNERPEKGF